MADATTHIKDLQKEVLHLRQLHEDQEERSCRNNIRVVGLPEQEEGPSMDLYMEDWLSQTVLQVPGTHVQPLLKNKRPKRERRQWPRWIYEQAHHAVRGESGAAKKKTLRSWMRNRSK
ncbi:hypothetical protein NDU88_003213 [Pleurodeles waltl]|uniref:Uncharacterized protein n=1 Tax=Pleurodeles waltl TaxID=8319 RepID=A0AAV7NIK8_PLEWA|nr:hypothetical protein NDU88_003213 [Pleurodeles waltl]